MTEEQITAIAERQSAYADCTPTLRGEAIMAFALELIAEVDREWLKIIEEYKANTA